MKRLESFRVFDEHVERYDRWYDRRQVVYETEVRVVRAALRGARRVVEIGVGTGRFASRVNAEVLGVDPAVRALTYAKRRGVEVVQGIGENLPLRSCAFDASLLVATLCFVQDPIRVLREAGRVSARVVACIIPRESSWGVLYASRKDSPFYRIAKLYTISELRYMILEAGLKPLECYSSLYTPPPGPRLPEDARQGCGGEAGFVCLVAESRACRL